MIRTSNNNDYNVADGNDVGDIKPKFSVKLYENALKKMFPDAVYLFLIEVGFQSDCSEPVEQQLLNEICWQLQFHIFLWQKLNNKLNQMAKLLLFRCWRGRSQRSHLKMIGDVYG